MVGRFEKEAEERLLTSGFGGAVKVRMAGNSALCRVLSFGTEGHELVLKGGEEISKLLQEK